MRGISNDKSFFQESIIDFARQEFKKDRSLTSREISWRWAYNCLEMLKKLGTPGRQLTSPAVMYIISVTMVEMGSSHYNFGSRTIADQLRNYVVKLAKERGKPQPREVVQEEEEEDQPDQPEEEVQPQPQVQPQHHEVQPQSEDHPEPDVPQAPLQPGEDVQADEDEPVQDEPCNPGKRKKRATVNDQFLIHLLHHYIKHAPDLMKRDRSDSGRAKAKADLEAMKKTKTTNQMNNGSRLSDFNTDNLAKKLAFETWWGRTGLLGFIDEHFDKIGKIQSHNGIKAEMSNIMRLAQDAKAGLRPPSPPRKTKKVAKPVATTPATTPVASPPRLLEKLREARKRLESGPVENPPPAKEKPTAGPPTASQPAPPTDGPPSPPPVDLLARIKVFKSLLNECRNEHEKHVLEHGLDENSGQIPKAKIVAFFNRPGLLKDKFSSAEIDACIRKMEEGNYLMESEGVIFII